MTEIPRTQHAIQYVGKDEIVHNTSKPVDQVGPTQLLLKVEACGICFSDTKLLHQFDVHPRKVEVIAGLTPAELAEIPSYKPGAEPTVPGHEPVCRVVAVGGQVTHFKIGDRVLVQADWKHMRTPTSNGSFGYAFEGALQEYVLVDERIVVHDGEEYLIQVSEGPTAAQVGLIEPWATVENAYAWKERQDRKEGGNLLVVVDAGAAVPRWRAARPPATRWSSARTPPASASLRPRSAPSTDSRSTARTTSSTSARTPPRSRLSASCSATAACLRSCWTARGSIGPWASTWAASTTTTSASSERSARTRRTPTP